MWSPYDSYLSAFKNILGLRVAAHKKYKYWEDAAKLGGFRVMHEKFCIVSDFPDFIKVDEQNRPHSESGPSHMWSDGWALYHWHGVQVPKEWIIDPDSVDPTEVLKCKNVEQRAAGAAIIGWAKMLDYLDCKVIDSDPDPDHGDLLELTLKGLPKPGRFLRAYCPRNGLIVEGVPYKSDIDGSPIDTVIAAQAWRVGETVAEFNYPPTRT